MDWTSFLTSVIGGSIIGLTASLFLVLNGRVMGVSGILNGLLTWERGDMLWRAAFVLGMIGTGVLWSFFAPEKIFSTLEFSPLQIGIGGLLVGLGTVIGSGCTSGHGVCGISRLSLRSIIATVTFVGFGILTKFFF